MSAVEVGVPPRGHGPTGPPEGGSLSSMGGMGGRTPPTTPKKGGGKMLAVKILMLDDTYTLFQIQSKALGAVLLEQTCRQLNLLESDYFGLEYTDGNTRYWLDLDKPMNRQVCLSQVEPVLRFCVKFYTPDPAQLEEEYTRYLFALQMKRDLSHGELHCNENTAALMASYIVQAECGDYVEEDYPDHRYLSLFKFVPTQNDDMERKIMDNHKKHIGMTPAAADLNLLETARRCDLYGIKMHTAKDQENVVLNLAAAHMGILVFQNYTKINTFSWAKIRKISFKRKRFLIKLHPEGYGHYKDVVEFFFDGRNECKNFWKKCVEHHGFFRCSTVKKLPRQKTRVLSRGSSFRYSGRTQKQVQDYVRDNYIKRQPFQRSQSFRHSPTVHTNVTNVGMSLSAQPLIPLRDNQCVGTPVSLSCGSMTLPSTGDTHSPGSPTQTETVDSREYDTRDRELETPSMTTSRQETLSPETSITSSPRRGSHDDLSGVYGPKSPCSPGSLSPQLGTPTPFTQSQHRGVPTPPPSPKFISAPKIPPHGVLEETPNAKSGTLNNSVQHENHVNRDVPLLNGNGHEKSASPARVSGEGEGEGEAKKRRYQSDRAYFVVKEMLTTERTYKKDLEVINVWFREEVKKEKDVPSEALTQLFLLIDPIYEFHVRFLKDLDNRLSQWDGRSHLGNKSDKTDSHKIGDLMIKGTAMLELYERYFDQHNAIVECVESCFKKNKMFELLYRDFETQKVCYLPITSFLLKPMQRLQHYHLLLDRLIQHYGSVNHHDYRECMTAKAKFQQCINNMLPSLSKSENLVKLMELQRDLVGIDNLVQPGREFLREGCLQKLSRKGYQQRMFFLFNDVLLYTNRTTTPMLQFKVHGQLPLRGVMVEENESRMGATNCFTIYGGNRALMVAANSEDDKNRWLEDLSAAITLARTRQDDAFHYLSLKSISASDEVLDKSDVVCEETSPSRGDKSGPQTRSNTTVHVCWHRATSVSAKDYTTAVQNQLSGYLLRKFKNSMGWQKLWVVFTNFCLFFYKTFQDEFPLASLPLLGYTISTPGEEDQIQKEFVFKLQFKNHVYFFRAESEYTFSRWMEVIASATKGSARCQQQVMSKKEGDEEEPEERQA